MDCQTWGLPGNLPHPSLQSLRVTDSWLPQPSLTAQFWLQLPLLQLHLSCAGRAGDGLNPLQPGTKVFVSHFWGLSSPCALCEPPRAQAHLPPSGREPRRCCQWQWGILSSPIALPAGLSPSQEGTGGEGELLHSSPLTDPTAPPGPLMNPLLWGF